MQSATRPHRLPRVKPYRLPRPIQRRIEAAALELLHPGGAPREDFAQPAGEPALNAPDSVTWRVCKNPLTLFVGGVAAVILELAEPRVRTGVWQHTSFRERPLERMQNTGLATMMTVYGPESRARAMIEDVVRRHERIDGVTPRGQRFRASDVELLDWVHATASFGFVEAWERFVVPLERGERDRYYDEGSAAARLYGAGGAPRSQAECEELFAAMQPKLEPSDVVFEFLRIVARSPLLPGPLRYLQPMLVAAAVEITPRPVRERLGLAAPALQRWQRNVVTRAARAAERLRLTSSPPVLSCRRLGLPDDYLY